MRSFSSRLRKFLFLPFVFIIVWSCSKDSDPENPADSSSPVGFVTTPYVLNTGRFANPDIPADNPLTVEGVRLGRMLFYEKKLSKDGSMSCASCHRQENAFTDTNRFSVGIHGLPGSRQSMAVFNMAWNRDGFFWDGRAQRLRDQSLMPIGDSLELDEELDSVVAKLQSEDIYRNQFMKAFGSTQVTSERMALAMEQFMNSIVSVNSKYDQYLNGTATLDTNEERGRVLFFAEFNPGFPSLSGADCQHCHSGLNFENGRYLNNGLDTDLQMQDEGRKKVTGQSRDLGLFKITSLRNIELTPPYMHDGRFTTLEQVVDHYNSGLKSSSTLDPTLVYPLNNGGLRLSDEDKRDLVAFLKTLTDQDLTTNPEYSDPFKP